jgi:hypothetical protein
MNDTGWAAHTADCGDSGPLPRPRGPVEAVTGQAADRLLPDPGAWPDLAVVRDWLPLACLLLEADGSALAVSREWPVLSGLAAEDSLAGGWITAVDQPGRAVLQARLRDAALAGQAGQADARLAGRRSRWWWRPRPADRLIVCVADLSDIQDRDGLWHRLEGELAPAATGLEELVGGVVHRLFAAGLSLASAQAIVGDGAAGDRVAAAVDELDRAIRDIRAIVFPEPGP